MTLTVAAVARRLGVAPATLRTWDRRYGLGPSEHTAGAHRRYSSADLARLVVMRRLTLEGVAPAEAAQIAATTAVADGGFALASVSTIPSAVIEAAVNDAEAIAGPTSGLVGAPAPKAEPTPDESEDLETLVVEHPDPPAGEDIEDWAVASLADRFSEEVRSRGVAQAWDTVLAPALATRDAAMHSAVVRSLTDLPVASGERAVLLAGVGDADERTPLLLAAAAALTQAGAGARTVGDRVPGRVLAAAVRRSRPPAVLLHAAVPGAALDLTELRALRPAPEIVLLGQGWGTELPHCDSLHDAVGLCVEAVRA